MATRRADSVADTDNDGRPTKTDERHERASASAADRKRDRAYKAGHRAGHHSSQHTPDEGDRHFASGGNDELAGYYDQGFADGRAARAAGAPPRAGRAPSSPSSSPRISAAGGAGTRVTTRLNMGDQISGFVLALFGWAIAVNYFRGGTQGVRDWLRAKFFNEPIGYTPPDAHSHGGTTPQAPGSPSNPHNTPPGSQPVTTPTTPTTPRVVPLTGPFNPGVHA